VQARGYNRHIVGYIGQTENKGCFAKKWRLEVFEHTFIVSPWDTVALELWYGFPAAGGELESV
jgi:hypothetical protein